MNQGKILNFSRIFEKLGINSIEFWKRVEDCRNELKSVFIFKFLKIGAFPTRNFNLTQNLIYTF